MKRFAQYLKEATMTAQDARTILGLGPTFNADDLKTAYRMHSRLNHPDKGGSVDKMKDINVANDVLSKMTSGTRKYGSEDGLRDWKAERAREDERKVAYAKVAMDTFENHFRPIAFSNHFGTIFGQTFTHKVLKDAKHGTGYFGGHDSYVSRTDEWANADRTIVLAAQFTISFYEMMNKPVLSAADAENSLSVSILSDILYNRKKVKLSQQNYKSFRDSFKALSDPEVCFPAKKMKAQTSKAATSTVLNKRDILLTFGSELEGRGDSEWMYVPVGEYSVCLHRAVFLRAGVWSMYHVVKKRGGGTLAKIPGYASWFEDHTNMTALWDGLKAIQRAGANYTPEQIAQACGAMQAKQRALQDAQRAAK